MFILFIYVLFRTMLVYYLSAYCSRMEILFGLWRCCVYVFCLVRGSSLLNESVDLWSVVVVTVSCWLRIKMYLVFNNFCFTWVEADMVRESIKNALWVGINKE